MKKKNMIIAGIGAIIAAAASVFFLKKRKNNGEQKPPKKAPQLDLENPGDQSNFPKSASESDLG
jgi:LPXTG-motif cell wall-anchored protein